MTYQPDLYDVVTPSVLQGDVKWYCAKALASGGPVLELGAGTGSVTVPIAATGVSIHALDSVEGMLQTLRSRLARQPAGVDAV
jgi:ubiquinone/menaquinone biosynthesis C-methylase UbiE